MFVFVCIHLTDSMIDLVKHGEWMLQWVIEWDVYEIDECLGCSQFYLLWVVSRYELWVVFTSIWWWRKCCSSGQEVEKMVFDGKIEQPSKIWILPFVWRVGNSFMLVIFRKKNELPSTVEAFRFEQHRWSCGPANLFRKMAMEIIRNEQKKRQEGFAVCCNNDGIPKKRDCNKWYNKSKWAVDWSKLSWRDIGLAWQDGLGLDHSAESVSGLWLELADSVERGDPKSSYTKSKILSMHRNGTKQSGFRVRAVRSTGKKSSVT